MNRLTHLLVITLLLCIPVLTYAQDDNDDEKENPSKYLVGAVPEKDGKVVFSQEMLLPGLSKDQVYDQMLSWMEKRLKKNKNKRNQHKAQTFVKGNFPLGRVNS